MKYRSIALIPAYEPDMVLLEVLKSLKEAGMEIVLVDDGSGVQYADLFAKASSYANVLTYTVNKGKGTALKAGMNYIKQNYEQNCIIVTVDADGQHRAEDAIRLCRIVEEQPDTFVLGSRKLKENVPVRSQFGNTITRFIYRLSTGLKVHDTQTGLRAFHAHFLPELLQVSGERYEYEMNVLLEFARKHIPIQETEIDTIYIGNNATSHFHTLRDSFRIYKEILKFSASSFVGFLTDYALYSLILFLFANLRLANIGARIVSAMVNYILNRKFVFQSETGIAKSAMQYFLLAAAILFGNTLFLETLVNDWGMNQMTAKILVEIVFFILSWLVQRSVIFRKKELGYKHEEKLENI